MKQDFTPEEWSKLIAERKARLVSQDRKISKAVRVRRRRKEMKDVIFNVMTVLSFIMLILICFEVF